MIPRGVEVFVGLDPIDLRWGFDRLCGVVTEKLGRNARSGALFVFFGRRRTAVKVVYCDRTGICVFYKRLDAHTLRAIETGEPQEAAWAARRAYEAADHHMMHRLGVEGEPQVLAHPIVQAEFSRQRRDLEELLGGRQESARLFARLRDRARADGSVFFTSHS